MDKEKLIKAIEQAEKEREELFVKRVLELYELEKIKENSGIINNDVLTNEVKNQTRGEGEIVHNLSQTPFVPLSPNDMFKQREDRTIPAINIRPFNNSDGEIENVHTYILKNIDKLSKEVGISEEKYRCGMIADEYWYRLERDRVFKKYSHLNLIKV